MIDKLVIVESPAKANTIKKFLGGKSKVVASMGHIRDLPKSKLGINIEKNFEPEYINIRGKASLINSLKKDAKDAKKVYLATDPDREGEAIAWHLAHILGIDPESVCRVTFNEITKNAVKNVYDEISNIWQDEETGKTNIQYDSLLTSGNNKLEFVNALDMSSLSFSFKIPVNLSKNTNVFNLVKVGQSIEEGEPLMVIQNAFEDKTLFIADGHHRYAAALSYRNMMRDKNPDLNTIIDTIGEALRLSAEKGKEDDITVIGVKIIK